LATKVSNILKKEQKILLLGLLNRYISVENRILSYYLTIFLGMKNEKHIMVFKTISPDQRRKEKSRRDGILLTVDFNLRNKDCRLLCVKELSGNNVRISQGKRI
jgi:hypothetical protein